MQQAEIRVKGQISERWSEWLDGLTLRHIELDETVLTGSALGTVPGASSEGQPLTGGGKTAA